MKAPESKKSNLFKIDLRINGVLVSLMLIPAGWARGKGFGRCTSEWQKADVGRPSWVLRNVARYGTELGG